VRALANILNTAAARSGVFGLFSFFLSFFYLELGEYANNSRRTTLDRAFFGSALSLLELQATALATRPSDHKAWDALAGRVSRRIDHNSYLRTNDTRRSHPPARPSAPRSRH
jgi:hypothetical protein